MPLPRPECRDLWGRTLHYADWGLGKVENTSNLIAGALVFALMLLGVAQILLRTVWNSPILGYIDIVEIGMVGFAVLSIAYVQRLGGHVRMELVITKLKGRALWSVELLGSVLTGFIVFVLIPASYAHFKRAFDFGDSTIDIELVTWPAKLVVPVALAILFVRVVLQFAGYLRMFCNPNLDPVGIPTLQSSAERAREEIDLARDVNA